MSYPVFCTVTDEGTGKEPVEKYYIVFIVKSEDAIMNDCKHLKIIDN